MEQKPQTTKNTQCKMSKSCSLLNGHQGTCQEKQVYFYQRPDGKVILMEDTEASLIHGKYKQLGVSDGSTYRKVIREGNQGSQDYDRKINRLEQQIDRLEDRLLDMELDSDRYKKTEKKIDALIDKKQKLDTEKQKKFGRLVEKAKKAEFAVAKGNLQKPPERHGVVLGDGANTQQVQETLNAMLKKR